MMIVDRIGRRKLVVGGNLAMCLTYVISTVLLAQFPPEVKNTGAHWGFIIMTWVYNFCFASMGSLCMSSLPSHSCHSLTVAELATNDYLAWMIPAEIFDTATRAKGVALGCMVSFAFKYVFHSYPNLAMAGKRDLIFISFL